MHAAGVSTRWAVERSCVPVNLVSVFDMDEIYERFEIIQVWHIAAL